MNESQITNKAYPLVTMLVGFISFLVTGMIFGLISLKANEVIVLLFGVPTGSLLVLFILHKLDKAKVLAVIIRSVLGGFAGFLLGLMLGEMLAWFIGLIIPSLRDLEQVKAQIVPNIAALIVADAFYGVLIGDLIYDRKSIKFFALVCGIASIPFGILLSMPIKIAWISFDQNLLFILTSFGTTTGLSIGLYSFLKLKNRN